MRMRNFENVLGKELITEIEAAIHTAIDKAKIEGVDTYVDTCKVRLTGIYFTVTEWNMGLD